LSKLFSKQITSWGVACNISRCKTMATIPNGQRIVMLLLELYDVMPMCSQLAITQRYMEIANILGIAERPAMRGLTALCDHGFLVKEANAHEKEKKANTWCFTSKMIVRYWRSWGDFKDINLSALPPEDKDLKIRLEAQAILNSILNANNLSLPPLVSPMTPPGATNDTTLVSPMTPPGATNGKKLATSGKKLATSDTTLLREEDTSIKNRIKEDPPTDMPSSSGFADLDLPRWNDMKHLFKEEMIKVDDMTQIKIVSSWPDPPAGYKINQEAGYCNHNFKAKDFDREVSRQCKIIKALNGQKTLLLKRQMDMTLQNFGGLLSDDEKNAIETSITIPTGQRLFIYGERAKGEHLAAGIFKHALFQMENGNDRQFGCSSIFYGGFEFLIETRKNMYEKYGRENPGGFPTAQLLTDNVEYMIIYNHSNATNKMLMHVHNDIDQIILNRPAMNFIICSTSHISQCSKAIQDNFINIEIK